LKKLEKLKSCEKVAKGGKKLSKAFKKKPFKKLSKKPFKKLSKKLFYPKSS